MRPLLVVLALVRTVHAGPVRVDVECDNEGRTKACPVFLRGFVDANKLLLFSPRASAEVIVYASSAEVGLADRVHLRVSTTLPNRPAAIETDTDLHTRADDDAQRAQPEPGV